MGNDSKNMAADATLLVFTDGSALRNGAAGFAVVWPHHPDHNFAAALPLNNRRTSNRAEYAALVRAFEIADDIDPIRAHPLECYTDSMLLVNSVTRWMSGWKRNGWRKRDGGEVLNLDLLRVIDSWTQLRALTLRHVPAHGRGQAETWKRHYNDIADQLARAAATRGPHTPGPASRGAALQRTVEHDRGF